MKKLLVVDGNSILNRAYYGIRPLTTKEGLFTNAVYGMINILTKQLEALAPDVCAIAFDRREPTFRHLAYAEYKAGRHAPPEELRMQFPHAKDCASAMGFSVIEQAGYEADDILGTLSAQASAQGFHSYLLTGDRDALQLIGDDVTVLLATNKDTIPFDRTRFAETYGVQPEQFVDIKALMGDSSDNIPGVAGIGEKTAGKLIAQYHDLETLYDHPEEKEIAKGVLAKLTAGREKAFFSRMLATIVRDAPLDMPFSSLPEKKEKEDPAALRALLVKLEFSALIKRLHLDTVEETPQDKVQDLDVDDYARLRFYDLSAELVKAKILYISPVEDEQCTIILEVNRHVESLLKRRFVNLDFVKNRYEGYRVSVKALRSRNNENGIYVLRDEVMKFIPVTILYNTQDVAIVESADDSTPLRLYDEVVVNADSYEEGKRLR